MNSFALLNASALIWAGVSLGGVLVAAPAKFKAKSLELPVALDVGRMQFQWMGVTELTLCAILAAAALFSPTHIWRWFMLPVALFALQRLVLMPILDARTLDIIAGRDVGESSLHLIYIAVEIVKFAALALIPLIFISQLTSV